MKPTCAGCSLLCADRDLDAMRCARKDAWLTSGNTARATIAGEVAPMGRALAEAARLLGNSRAPVIVGCEHTPCEAVQSLLAIADRIGATVLSANAPSIPRGLFQQGCGELSCTLGELVHTADAIYTWGQEWQHNHPRLAERLQTERPERRWWLLQPPDEPIEWIWQLRAALGGKRSRQRYPAINRLAEQMKSHRYAVLIAPESAPIEALRALVSDWNELNHARLLVLGEAINAEGAQQVLTWQSGNAAPMSFQRGYPSADEPEQSLEALVHRRAIDCLLAIGELPESTRKLAESVPTIHCGEKPLAGARVTLPYPSLLATTGHLGRCDGQLLAHLPPTPTSQMGAIEVWTTLRELIEANEGDG